MSAIVGHLIFFVAALFSVVRGFGIGEYYWEPLMLIPMAVSAISVITLTRNIRGVPSVN